MAAKILEINGVDYNALPVDGEIPLMYGVIIKKTSLQCNYVPNNGIESQNENTVYRKELDDGSTDEGNLSIAIGKCCAVSLTNFQTTTCENRGYEITLSYVGTYDGVVEIFMNGTKKSEENIAANTGNEVTFINMDGTSEQTYNMEVKYKAGETYDDNCSASQEFVVPACGDAPNLVFNVNCGGVTVIDL